MIDPTYWSIPHAAFDHQSTMDKEKEIGKQAVVSQTTFYNSEDEQIAHINILVRFSTDRYSQ